MEQIKSRIYGASHQPVLAYLPGLHGDWTLVGSFRSALRERVCFIEFTYPRQSWHSLDDYAMAVLAELRAHQITRAWILGESFGSLVAWSIVRHSPQLAEGVILAGGFVRYPYPSLVSFARRINRAVPMSVLRMFLQVYKSYAVFRHRSAAETLVDVHEFVARRSEPMDREAICSRYNLIANADFCQTAQGFDRPVYQLYGLVDPIVPWWPVGRWLRRYCQSHRQSRMIWTADHNVLGTAPQKCADQILQWIHSRGSPADAALRVSSPSRASARPCL